MAPYNRKGITVNGVISQKFGRILVLGISMLICMQYVQPSINIIVPGVLQCL